MPNSVRGKATKDAQRPGTAEKGLQMARSVAKQMYRAVAADIARVHPVTAIFSLHVNAGYVALRTGNRH